MTEGTKEPNVSKEHKIDKTNEKERTQITDSVPPQNSCTSPRSVDSRHIIGKPKTKDLAFSPKEHVTSVSESSSCSLSKSSTQVSPCPRCVDFARIFFDSLHLDLPAPFTMPTWVHRHESFATVVVATQRRDVQPLDKATASDAIIFAVCGCFTLFDSPMRPCCDFALIRTMLNLPSSTKVRRRARNLIFELILHASAQHDSLILREIAGGQGLLDALANSIHSFFTSQLVAQSTDEKENRTAHLEERHDTILCLQILTYLAKQQRNLNILLTHSRLVRVTVMLAAHPLVDEHILSLSLHFISLCGDRYLTIAETVFPCNRLIESVISTMELCSNHMLTSLICPIYLPEKPDKQFLSSVCQIALAFALSPLVISGQDAEAGRLLSVVVSVLLTESESPFDTAHIVDIARVFTRRIPHFVIRDESFVAAIVGMFRHVCAGQSARQTFRCLVKTYPAIHVPDDVQKLLVETMCTDNDGQ